MCLGIPANVVEVEGDGQFAVVDTQGVKTRVIIRLLPDVKPGDYVMVHAGCAIEKIDREDADERLRIWRELMEYDNTAQY